MDAISRLFDPLRALLHPFWALVGRNMFLTAGVLSVALGVAALLHSTFFILVLGMAVGTVLMLKSEADHPRPPTPPSV
jgi:hypothetical protein